MLPSKWESGCSTKLIHFCKKLPLSLDCRQSKYSLWIYNTHILSILGVAFAVPFLCYFQKHQILVVKNFWNNFCCIISNWRYLYFCPSWCLFLHICPTKKLTKKKHQQWNLRDTLKRSYQKLTWQSITGKFHHWQKLELCKVVHNSRLNW